MLSKRIKKLVLIFNLLIGVFLMSACQNVNGILGGTGTGAIITVVSNEISFPITKIRSLNPLNAKDEDAFFINKLIYQGLFEMNEDMKAMPVLARNAEFSADGVSINVELQQNIHWSNGELFSPRDVKYSIDAYRKAAQENQTMYASYANAISSCKIEKNNSVTITFKDAESAALENLVFPIMPVLSHGNKGGGAISQGELFVPIGTGPYMVTSINADKEIILGANPNYEGKRVDNILIFKVFPERDSAISLFEIGTVDFMVLKEPDRDILLQDKPVKEVAFASNEVELIGFNVENPHLSKKKIRQAIAYAIDSEGILEDSYYGNGIRCETIYPPGYLGVPKGEEHYQFNTKKARLLISEEGYKDINGDGYFEDAEGNPLHVRLMVNDDNALRKHAAQTISSNLMKAGISVTTESLSWEAYSLELARGGFDIYLGGYKFRDPNSIKEIFSGYDTIPEEPENEDLRVMINRLTASKGTEEKIAAFDQVNKRLLDELPQYCLFYKTYGAICVETLEGDILPTYFNIYNSCETFTVNRIIRGE